MNQQPYTIGNYLLDRLSELGIRHIFGVPGDYNLSFLDSVLEHSALEWIGNCNELNAAYAADGYARIHGIAALVTTFGVGELSAVNAVAGSYAEDVPVIKITGSPATKVADRKLTVHHTLGDGDFDHFSRMYQEVTGDSATLAETGAEESIDRVLRHCWAKKKPVYLNIPVDIHSKPARRPAEPLLKNLLSTDDAQLAALIHDIVPFIEKAARPVILADYQVYRRQAEKALLRMAESSGFPVATLSMGKGVISETHPQFIGVYSGKTSTPYLRRRIDTSDCIIAVGTKFSDSITSVFSQEFDEDSVISLQPDHVRFREKTYPSVQMADVLDALSGALSFRDRQSLDFLTLESQQPGYFSDFYSDADQPLKQSRFWLMMRQFIREDDVLIADQGTSFFGAATLPLKEGMTFIGQPLWGSIGYTLPALLGTQLADPERRNILIIGDGAFQLTGQEISTMMRHDLKPIIFVINNDGYTVERAIHGPAQIYNDIEKWDYCAFAASLSRHKPICCDKAATEKELILALKSAIMDNHQLHFIEVVMGHMDMPDLLKELGRFFAQQNG